jgi:hypothetical protein
MKFKSENTDYNENTNNIVYSFEDVLKELDKKEKSE